MRRSRRAAESSGPAEGGEDLRAIYTAVAARRNTFDTLMWQVPAIALTAQAFLFTIALRSPSSLAGAIAAGLALVVAVIAMQTMGKHRANELTDSRLLERMEATMVERSGDALTGLPVLPHAAAPKRAKAVRNKLYEEWFNRRKSFWLWIILLRVFALASIAALVLNIVDREALAGPGFQLP